MGGLVTNFGSPFVLFQARVTYRTYRTVYSPHRSPTHPLHFSMQQTDQMIVCVNGSVYPLREDRRLNVVQLFGEGADLLDPKFRPATVIPVDPMGWTVLKLLPHAHYLVRVGSMTEPSGQESRPARAPPVVSMLPRKLLVHNLPFYCTAEMLGKFFEQFDLVVEADILRHLDGTPKGKGYVMLQTPKGTIAALQSPSLVFHGSHLQVEGDSASLVPYTVPSENPQEQIEDTATALAGLNTTAYFVMKCSSTDALADGIATGTWSTQRQNEANLNMALKEHASVVLIFSVNNSKEFQGFATMAESIPIRTAEVKENRFAVRWSAVGNVKFADTMHRATDGMFDPSWATAATAWHTSLSHGVKCDSMLPGGWAKNFTLGDDRTVTKASRVVRLDLCALT